MARKERRIIKIVITYKDGTEEMIYTDDTVYIMNDNGKTCDTIKV